MTAREPVEALAALHEAMRRAGVIAPNRLQPDGATVHVADNLAAAGFQITRRDEGLRAALERLLESARKTFGNAQEASDLYGAMLQARAALAAADEKA